uniref:Methylated-DNA--protein-cysteine methyltransferase n=1 Tax=Thermosporothrix sp. COM3 TaxID=2490863 RepID=A0A455SHP9_9CHLR|nr:methylated-DNA--protein-cysteine methyltransferase [Thermosporothrix sp. COM3]
MKKLSIDTIETPIGGVLLVVDDGRICSLDYEDYEQRMLLLLRRRYREFELQRVVDPCGFSSRVRAYFAGNYAALNELPVVTGGTDFQRQVWEALRTIPVGTTRSYGELAKQLGKPNASRAVGAANGLNPIAIIVPCHRVIGANAALTGYAGGIARKEWLLRHEGIRVK